MRRLVIALIACAWSVPAASNCDDEAHPVRERVWNSGPFHFEITRWSKDSRTKICGEIVPGVAQRERSCDSAAGTQRETVWIGDRKWEKDGAGWRGPYSTIWTHQDRVPSLRTLFSAGQVTCLGPVVIDGRATIKYEFARQVADRVWVETIFADEQSGIPVRFETRGRSDAYSGSLAIYRHDSAIRIDPPAVELTKRWSDSLKRLSQEAQKGDPACRTRFFAAVQRGRMAAFEFEIKGTFESIPADLAGIFAPSDAIYYRFTPFVGRPFGETIAAGGQAWANQSWPKGWVDAPQKLSFVEKLIASLFPPSDYVGQVRCLSKLSVDGRDSDAYEYDFYRDRESARRLDSHRSMIVDKTSGIPFRNISLSRTYAPQWVETRRYDASLTIQVPPPPPARPPEVGQQGSAGAQWLLRGLTWPLPPFVTMPPAEAPWPPSPGRH